MRNRVEHLSDNVTLHLGDCREVVPTLGRVDSVITDPPYGMHFRSNHRSLRHDFILNDSAEWPLELAVSLPSAYASYVFCRWDDLRRVPKPRSLVTWVKNNWSMGDLKHEHARQTEVALFYPGPDHYFPKGRPSDVIEVARTGNFYHPTEKPVQLMSAFVNWTVGDVLDPFMGSGSTGVACVQFGRKFIGIELDEGYFDIACKRISDELKRPRFDLGEPVQQPVQEVLL